MSKLAPPAGWSVGEWQDLMDRISASAAAERAEAEAASKCVRSEVCSYVYVVASPTASKVGIALDVQKRHAVLQYYRGEPLTVYRHWHRPKDANLIEWMTKQMLQPVQETGEWFLVSPAKLARVVRIAIGLSDARACHLFKQKSFPRNFSAWQPKRWAEQNYSPEVEKLVRAAVLMMGPRATHRYYAKYIPQ